MHAIKELQQALKVFGAFPHYESFSMFFTDFPPTLRNFGCAAGEILDTEQMEIRLPEKAFVLSRWYKQIKPIELRMAISSWETGRVITIASVNRARPAGRNTRFHSRSTPSRSSI